MNETHYWDSVAQEWQASDRHALWRATSDDIHIGLLRRWGILSLNGLALKTDLFDEAAVGGLGAALDTDATHLIGMDLSRATASAAKSRLQQGEIMVADVRALPLADASVDMILSNSTLDHFEDRQEIMRALIELGRVLAKGGKMLVTLDNPQHPVIWMRQHLPWRALHRLGLVPYRMGETLSLSELTTACRQIGLTVERTGTFMHCPRVLAVWVGKLWRRLGIRSDIPYRRFFGNWEFLRRWPTSRWTGRFVAVLALKENGGHPAPTGRAS